MSTTTKNCEECAHHRAVLGNELACALDHKPRWYSPKGTLDQNYGWKRKCDDFRPTGHNAKVSGGGTPSAALPGYAGDNNNNGET